jgi:pimeloyl-ACP methyl ester carboxylesterase
VRDLLRCWHPGAKGTGAYAQRVRTVHVDPPAEIGTRDGLAYALFLPREPPTGGVVILHGAGSCKESHFDFARVLRAADMAAVAFDQRGHGASEGAMDGRALDDVGRMAALLREALGETAPIGLRGSSMGGYLALVAAARIGAAAVVAICPASSAQLVRGLRAGRFSFKADRDALEAVLSAHDATQAIAQLDAPVLLMHAEGDDQVPVTHSHELHAANPASRLLVVRGGHHRSVQHDGELQAAAARFLARAFSAARAAGR